MTQSLTAPDLMIAALLLCLNAGLSLAFSLGIGRSLVVAALRMVAQLLVLATILRWLFATPNGWLVFATMLIMGAFAGYEIALRQDRRGARRWAGAAGGGIVLLSGWVITLPFTALLLEADPWYSPALILPLFGMVAGNAMTGIALAFNTFTTALHRDTRIIEARLMLGATRRGALADPLRQAIRTGLTPTINGMAAMGVVAIPGMMTGQILAGATPMEAAKYQMFVMFLIAGTSALGVLGATLAMAYRLSDTRHRLRLDRL